MFARTAKILAMSVLLAGGAATAANADCHDKKTTGTVLGAGTGGVIGDVVTHGSVVGLVGGAVVGGLAGHSIGASQCHHRYYRHGYYDRYHHWHSYG
jgi:osmotically inducible lipoprotein OsmB